jgi:hypothetical protein
MCFPLCVQVMSRILAEPPPQLGSIQPREYSRLMHDLAGQCLRKEPGERPTAQQLLQHAFFRQAKGTAWATSKLLSQVSDSGDLQCCEMH